MPLAIRRSTRGSSGSPSGKDDARSGSGSGGDDGDSGDGNTSEDCDGSGLIGCGSDDGGPDDDAEPETSSSSSSSSSSPEACQRPSSKSGGSRVLSSVDNDSASICLTPSPRAVAAARGGAEPTAKLRDFGITTATIRDILCHTNAAPTGGAAKSSATAKKKMSAPSTLPTPPPNPLQQRERLVLALRVVRQALSDEKAAADGIIDDVVATGILPRVVELMSPFTNAGKTVLKDYSAFIGSVAANIITGDSSSKSLGAGAAVEKPVTPLHIADPLVVFEAAWILTNIGSGRSEHVMALINEGVPAALVLVLHAEIPIFSPINGSGGVDNGNAGGGPAAAMGGRSLNHGNASHQLVVVPPNRRTETVDDVHAQVMWAVGNISGDGTLGRDAMLAVNGMLAVLQLVDEHMSQVQSSGVHDGSAGCRAGAAVAAVGSVQNKAAPTLSKFNDSFSVLGLAPWTISNLCRSTPRPPLSATESAIPVLGKLLCMPGLSSESIQDALWALYYIVSGGSSSEGPDEDRRRIQAVLLDNGMPFDFASWMVDLVSRFAGPNVSSSCTSNMTRSSACSVNNDLDVSVCSVAVQLLGSIVASDKDLHTQVLVDAGLLKPLRAILDCQDAYFQKNIHHHVLWLLSNVTAGTEEQADAVASADIFPVTIHLLENRRTSDQVKKEAVYVLCNAFKMPVSAGVVGLLIRLQCPRTFCSIICNGPEGAKPVAVQGIECLLTRLWMMVEDAYGDIGDDVKDGTGDSTGLMLDTTTVRDDVANTTQPNCNDTSNVISSAPESVAFHASESIQFDIRKRRAITAFVERSTESRSVIETLRKSGCLAELENIGKLDSTIDSPEIEECIMRARKIQAAVKEFTKNLDRKSKDVISIGGKLLRADQKVNFDTKVGLDYGERRTSKDGNKYEEDLEETNRKQDTSEEATNRSSAASRKKGKKGKSKGKKGRK